VVGQLVRLLSRMAAATVAARERGER